MNAPFTVALSKLIKELKLERIYLPRDASEILVTSSDVNRPGLYLAGFYDFFDNVRIQLMGKAECGYLETLCEGSRAQILDDFFAQKPPALIITRGLDVTDEMLKFAKKYEVPILRTEESTSNFMSGLIAILSVDLAPRITRHGVLVEVYGEGILLLGESGVGKSETAIELVNRGHRLIGAIKVTEKIDMVIQLEHWNSEKVYDRMGMENEYTDILGLNIPSLTIPVRPGRNLAIIIEVAAMNNRQKKMGYNAAQKLLQKLGMVDAAQPETVVDWDSY